jgi:hypothetical protein
VKSKYSVFFGVQNPPADKREIRDVFLILAAPAMAAVMASHHFETRMTHMRFFSDAISETGVTGSKNVPQYAVAGDIFTIPTKLTQSNTVAVRAGFLRQCDGFRAGPVDFHECSLLYVQ